MSLLDEKTSEVLKEIAEERMRQIEEEGYTPDHDVDCHPDHALALAAAHYCAPDHKRVWVRRDNADGGCSHVSPWPWNQYQDKRGKHDYRRRLIIAAAFIAAEIERVDRDALETAEHAKSLKQRRQDETT